MRLDHLLSRENRDKSSLVEPSGSALFGFEGTPLGKPLASARTLKTAQEEEMQMKSHVEENYVRISRAF